MFHRRPLISPARLNLKGQKLSFTPAQFDKTRHNFEDIPYPDSSLSPLEFNNFMAKSLSELLDASSACELMFYVVYSTPVLFTAGIHGFDLTFFSF